MLYPSRRHPPPPQQRPARTPGLQTGTVGKKILIVDCHTHIWQSPDQLGQMDLGEVRHLRPRPGRVNPNRSGAWRSIPAADSEHHWAQSATVDKSIVLGFKSRYLRAEIPNRY